MKKIGIITLVGSDNCGSLLQTYALQTYLENNFECIVEVINYQDKVSKRTYGIFAPAILMRPIQLFRTIQYYKRLKKQQLDYNRFRTSEIHLTSKKYHNLKQLKDEKWDYDILISGSDQIWNWPEAYIDETYFLDWGGEARRIAYAPSTGGSINTQNGLLEWVNKDIATLSKIRACLATYQMISIREESGQKYFERLLGKNVPLVADPTLMLDRSFFHELAGENIVNGEYIFYYSYGYKNNELNMIVSKAAERLNLPVYVINASLWNHKNNKEYKFVLHNEGGPYAYLSLMKYAKYVFAESFHGCIFAYIFKKNFWFVNNFSDGRVEARIDSLLSYLELSERILHSKNFETTKLEAKIDYEKKFVKFEELYNQSKIYLQKAIETEYCEDFTKDSVEYSLVKKVIWNDMSLSSIKERIDEFKMKENLLKKCLSDDVFEYYFKVDKLDFSSLKTDEIAMRIVNSDVYKQQCEYNRLQKKYGYIGHLFFRTKQKFSEGGVRAVLRAFITKYKWWFRIGY